MDKKKGIEGKIEEYLTVICWQNQRKQEQWTAKDNSHGAAGPRLNEKQVVWS